MEILIGIGATVAGLVAAGVIGFAGRWLVQEKLGWFRPRQDAALQLQPLEPRLEHDDNAPGNQVWWNVAVSNANGSPVTRCYGKIVEYHILRLDDASQGRPVVPRKGTMLPWRAAPEGERRLEADIGGQSADYLDLAYCEPGWPVYLTPQLSGPGEKQPLTGRYPLPTGTYEAEIEISSNAQPIRRRLLTVKLDFGPDTGLHAHLTKLA
jgi:hypothetical protein